MNRRSDELLAESLVGFTLIIALVVLVIGVWLVVKSVDLVIRQLAAHPDNKPLWIALGVALLVTVPVVLTGGRPPLLLLLWFVSLLALVLVAWIVELVYDPQLQVEEALVDQVLHQAWWGE